MTDPQCMQTMCASFASSHFTFAHSNFCFSLQYGQGTLKNLLSDSSHASCILDAPSIVGVDVIMILRFAKVAVLFVASDTASPSVVVSYLSTSSSRTILHGLDANEAGEFDPVITTKPPAKDLDNIVLPESLDLESLILPFKDSEAVIIFENLWVLHDLAISKVGMTTSIGAGSWAM